MEAMMEAPDLLQVTVSHYEDISADHADLFVLIKGSSLLNTHAALTQAKSVGCLKQSFSMQ
jgi:hypothetical protein